MLNVLRRTSRNARQIQALHAALNAAARQPVFFQAYGVADTVDGRFDMVALHAWLALRWLRGTGRAELAQGLSDAIFVAFDEALRDLGNSDMGMGPRMKKLGNAFAGRLKAYEEAKTEGALADAILRNVYRGGAAHAAAAGGLARYAFGAAEHLNRLDPAAGTLDFGPVSTTFVSL